MTNEIIPISDEQAKAIQEALKTLQGVGGFLKDTFGTVPQDTVGLLGGDYLKVRRVENLYRTIQKAKKRLEDEDVAEPDASPSIAIPIMIAAADESRDELQEIWAALLAAAADPKKSGSFRLKFIEVAKQLDPLDPLVLKRMNAEGLVDYEQLGKIAEPLGLTKDQVGVSVAVPLIWGASCCAQLSRNRERTLSHQISEWDTTTKKALKNRAAIWKWRSLGNANNSITSIV